MAGDRYHSRNQGRLANYAVVFHSGIFGALSIAELTMVSAAYRLPSKSN